MCVNALHRASPISTDSKNKVQKLNYFVSMPYIGLLPFLRAKDFVEQLRKSCVNALHRASPISTKGELIC